MDLEQLGARAAPTGCVLVVDDQLSSRKAIRALVEGSMGAVVLEAESGARAVELAREARPDLVVMDVYMPGIDGILGTAAIKALRSETVVVLTSSTHPDDLPVAARVCGADAVIWKRDLCPALLAEVVGARGALPPRGAHTTCRD